MFRFTVVAVLLSLTSMSLSAEAPADRLGTFACDRDTIYVAHPLVKKEVRFAAVADSHFAFLDDRDAKFRKHAERMMQWPGKEEELDRVFAAAKKHNAEFVAMIGDMISFPSLANIDFLKRKIAASGFECWYVAGNHDWCFEGYEGQWAKQREKWIPERLLGLYRGKDPKGYSFVKKGVRFVFVDNSTCRVTEEQLAFVRKELESGEPVVLFVHVPFYVNGRSDADTMAYPTKKPDGRSVLFRELVFSAPNVVAVFAGHDHYLQAGCVRGVPQFILPAAYTTGRGVRVVLKTP